MWTGQQISEAYILKWIWLHQTYELSCYGERALPLYKDTADLAAKVEGLGKYIYEISDSL